MTKIGLRLISMVMVAAWLVSLWWHKRPFPATRMDWPLWALGGGWLLAALLGEDPRVSLEFVWNTFFHIMLFYIAVDIIRSGHQRWLFEALFLAGGVVVLFGALLVLLWYFGNAGTHTGWPEIGGYTTIPPVMPVLSLILNHKNPTRAYMILLIPVALAWSNTLYRRDLKWGLRLLAAGLLGVLLLTQSRGAYLALVALVGFSALIWLLRPDVRSRFPRGVQPLIAPRILLAGAMLGGVAAIWGLYQIIVRPSHPDPDDICRLDLWYSALQIFDDHPLVGVGPLEFKGVRLLYGNWEYSQSYLILSHAHNAFFNILAEGGILLVALSLWVIVRAARMWWTAWVNATPLVRRRLEGILIAMLAFGVHNMVDTFLQTQFFYAPGDPAGLYRRA